LIWVKEFGADLPRSAQAPVLAARMNAIMHKEEPHAH